MRRTYLAMLGVMLALLFSVPINAETYWSLPQSMRGDAVFKSSDGSETFATINTNGVSIPSTNQLKTNEIAETTSATGVLIDGVRLKDGQVQAASAAALTVGGGVTTEVGIPVDLKLVGGTNVPRSIFIPRYTDGSQIYKIYSPDSSNTLRIAGNLSSAGVVEIEPSSTSGIVAKFDGTNATLNKNAFFEEGFRVSRTTGGFTAKQNSTYVSMDATTVDRLNILAAGADPAGSQDKGEVLIGGINSGGGSLTQYALFTEDGNILTKPVTMGSVATTTTDIHTIYGLTQLANSRTAYTNTTVPTIYASTVGGSGFFNEAGHLIFEPRLSGATRDVIVMGTGGSAAHRLSGSGSFTLGISKSANTQTIQGVNLEQRSDANSTTGLYVYNENTGASANSIIASINSGTGDAFFRSALGTSRSWAWGIDNSDNDSWKLSTINAGTAIPGGPGNDTPLEVTITGAVVRGPEAASVIHQKNGAETEVFRHFTGGSTRTLNSNPSNAVGTYAFRDTFTNLSTSGWSVGNAQEFGTSALTIFIINVDGDVCTFNVNTGIENGSSHRFTHSSPANCSVSEGSEGVFSITGLGDSRTYTLAFSTSTAAATLSASSTATGDTTLSIYRVRAQ